MSFIENNKHLENQIKGMLSANNDWLFRQFGEAKLIIKDAKQNAEAIVFWIEKKGIKISNSLSEINEKEKLVTCTIRGGFEYSLEIMKLEHTSNAINYLKELSSHIDYLLAAPVKEEKEVNECFLTGKSSNKQNSGRKGLFFLLTENKALMVWLLFIFIMVQCLQKKKKNLYMF